MSTFLSIRTSEGYKNLALSRVIDLEVDYDVLKYSISGHQRFAYRVRYYNMGEYITYYTDLENYLLLKSRIDGEMNN
mgnify:CR=1 FL=1